MLRLLLCDYQRAARYYTIYRTFKQRSSDDFTTILRLLATTIPAGTLRLLLTSIGYRATARKEMRREPPMVPRRARAAGLPRRVEGARLPALTADPVPDLQPPGVESIETPPPLAWSMICYTVWHGSTTGAHLFIYLIIIGGCAALCSIPAWRWYLVSAERVRALVCPPAWRKWYYSRLCRSGIVGG